jgi:hypothetical protein
MTDQARPADDPLAGFEREGGATIFRLELEAGRREQAKQASLAATAKRQAAREERERAAKEASRPVSYSSPELLAMDLPPQKWLVADLIPAGLCLLASPPKIGKTWLNLQLAIAAATGGMFCGYAMATACKVLFLDLEGGPRRERLRLKKLLNGAAAPENLHVAFDWPNMDNGGLEELDSWIEIHGFDLIIIDIWNKFRRRTPRGVNVYDFDSDVGHEVQNLVRKHDITVLLTHHTKKGRVEDHMESISGSQGLPGAVDTNIVIARKRGTGDAVLDVTPRDGREHHLAVDFVEGQWTILGDAGEVLGSKRRNKVHALLTQRGTWMSPKDIADELEDDIRSIRRTLRTMRDEGVVAVDAKGRFRLAG